MPPPMPGLGSCHGGGAVAATTPASVDRKPLRTVLAVLLVVVGGTLVFQGGHHTLFPATQLVDDQHLTYFASESERESMQDAVRAWGVVNLLIGLAFLGLGARLVVSSRAR